MINQMTYHQYLPNRPAPSNATDSLFCDDDSAPDIIIYFLPLPNSSIANVLQGTDFCVAIENCR